MTAPLDLTTLIPDAWRLYPDTYAHRMSGGRWQAYRHLRILSRTIHRAIRRGNGRVIVSMPPRHGKSEFTSYWLPTWFLDQHPDKRVMMASYGAELAQGFSRRVRDTLAHHPLAWARPRASDGAAHRFALPEGGSMFATGVGGPATGKGADLAIIDDPVKNWEDAQSQRKREAAVDWFNSVLYTRVEPGGTIVVVMTRWHERDLAGWLEHEHSDEWEIVRMPALAEPGVDPLGRNIGDPLCPERYDAETLNRIRMGVGSRIWAALYQQRPAPADGALFRREWLANRFATPPAEFDRLIQSWDLSFGSDSDAASYVVGAVWGAKGARRYRLDEWRARASFTETRQAIRDMTAKYPGARPVLVEDKANGPAVISDLQNEVVGILPVKVQGSKYARAVSVTPSFEAGQVWLPANVPWAGGYVEELVTFPNGANDDRVDETSQALNYLNDGVGALSWW